MKNKIIGASAFYTVGFLTALLSALNVINFPFVFEQTYSIGQEANVAVGLLLILISSVYMLFLCEKYLMEKELKAQYALWVLLGPLGYYLLKKAEAGKKIPHEAVKENKAAKKRLTISGIIFSVIVLGLTVGGITYLIGLNTPFFLFIPAEVKNAEVQAYRNLKKIAEAQEIFYEEDRDRDGVKNYAHFYIHLWRSVDGNANPFDVNLIPKDLGFAMRAAYDLNGYFYVDIHTQVKFENGEYKKTGVDPLEEFKMASFPKYNKKTGQLSFLMNEKGDIFVQELNSVDPDTIVGLYVYPPFPEKSGWVKINSEEELKAFQETVDYGSLRIDRYYL